MYDLATGIYTAEQIRDMLTSDREAWYEFDLLDKNDNPIGQVSATGTIDYNATATIKRAAAFYVFEDANRRGTLPSWRLLYVVADARGFCRIR